MVHKYYWTSAPRVEINLRGTTKTSEITRCTAHSGSLLRGSVSVKLSVTDRASVLNVLFFFLTVGTHECILLGFRVSSDDTENCRIGKKNIRLDYELDYVYAIQPIDWSIACLIVWLFDSLTDWLIDWLNTEVQIEYKINFCNLLTGISCPVSACLSGWLYLPASI